MQINLNPTSERGASRDAVNRPRETLGDSHLISSDPRSRFGLVCDLLCCRGNKWGIGGKENPLPARNLCPIVRMCGQHLPPPRPLGAYSPHLRQSLVHGLAGRAAARQDPRAPGPSEVVGSTEALHTGGEDVVFFGETTA